MSESDAQAKKAKLIKIVIAVVMLGAAGVIFYSNIRQPPPPPAAVMWFYDVNAKTPVAKPDHIPTGDIARAYASGCGGCADPSKLVVRYIERFSADAAAELKKSGINDYNALASEGSIANAGRMVKRPTETTWVEFGSDEANAILNDPVTCPGGEAPMNCLGPDTK